ncbi:MAG: DUF4416 family protein [Deltaproteobacteria bacterium]|nr:DUF4416 family protein [Deltaproteobacteria bacterium]
MSHPQSPKPAKLVIGLFTRKRELMAAVVADLMESFGPIDLVSPLFPFDFTTYYEKEMGTALVRRIFVFKSLIQQDDLADIKLRTNAIETLFSADGMRQVNIDPGYLLMERLVLATGKNFAHRIYIGKRIYADLTLIYQKNGYQPLPWTYPDYAHDTIRDFLILVRNKYMEDLKEVLQ